MLRNKTDLQGQAIATFAKRVGAEYGITVPDIEVRYRPKQRGDVRYMADRLRKCVVLFVRRYSKQKPYTLEFNRAFAACLRAGMWRLSQGSRVEKSWKPSFDWPGDLALWVIVDEPKPVPGERQAKNAEKARKALARCEARIAKAEQVLKRLHKRKKGLARSVRYYERVIEERKEGPEFEAKLKQLVANKWKDEEGDAGVRAE